MKWRIYRIVMKLAHRYHWHYAPPCYPDGDTLLWCKWCGLQQTIKRRGDKAVVNISDSNNEWNKAALEISRKARVP